MSGVLAVPAMQADTKRLTCQVLLSVLQTALLTAYLEKA